MNRKQFLTSLLGIPVAAELVKKEKIVHEVIGTGSGYKGPLSYNILPDVDKTYNLVPSDHKIAYFQWKDTGITRKLNGNIEKLQTAFTLGLQPILKWVTIV